MSEVENRTASAFAGLPVGDHSNELPQKSSGLSHLRSYFSIEVTTNHADLLLLLCCLVTGFVDSTFYNGRVFWNKGNTIFVALGASGQNTRPYGWARSLSSIGFFIIGSLFFSRFNRTFGARRRGTIVSSFLLQSICILIASGLIEGGAIDGTVSRTPIVHWNQLAPIALLSFQSAGQIVSSRALDVGEIPTVVITSLLCDLFSDPLLFDSHIKNPKRNRRAAAFILTLVGAIVGGWVYKATGGVQTMLWVAAAVKFLLALSWIFWASA
ncbi:hypothetical protein LHYA1_G005817 [Lachnellula hyalina]|uniref:DUF1275 domain protein n=1 Tax=Lachnellula hyalina TaxID=1316788 RepID=A0A8H8R3N0_9HELO|nr:uncharacterized protein LHYA1_G005817 [Lachnellula hyalina]TVY26299.1 hypothetical protein LHYA1_G005817 [Lachnellula hyalina]